MINEINKTEIIDRYLNGELEPELQHEFQNKLDNDENFRREVELQQSIIANIENVGKDKLKENLKSIHRELAEENQNFNSYPSKNGKVLLQQRSRIIWLAAASVIIILAFSFIIYTLMLSSGALYAEEFKPYALSVVRGDESQSNLVELYEHGNYEQFVNEFETLPSPTLKENFLAGNIYLIKGRSSEAIVSFEKVISDNKDLPVSQQRFFPDAEYYLLLSYIQAQRIDDALLLAKNIRNMPEHPYEHKITTSFLWKLKLLRFKQGW